MIIPATMITRAAPSTAIAISPAEYFVFFVGVGACCGWRPFFFFLRVFFDMLAIFYPKSYSAGLQLMAVAVLPLHRFRNPERLSTY